MGLEHSKLQLLYLIVLVLFPSGGTQLSEARTLTVVNNCTYTIWPGTLSNAGQQNLLKGGFVLPGGARQEITAPAGWAGRFWGRTGCQFDALDAGTCETGDCGRGLYCDGAGGVPPATLAEFTLDGYGSQDFYDVSLVDGYNVPLAITEAGGTGKCGNPGCVADLNLKCPAQLQVVLNGTVVSCKSACEAFQTDIYCCSGAYNSPTLCGPTEFSQTFKEACPTAYSYAYDDASSTYTCTGGVYEIAFCPNGTSVGGGIPPTSIPPSPPSTISEPPFSSPQANAAPPRLTEFRLHYRRLLQRPRRVPPVGSSPFSPQPTTNGSVTTPPRTTTQYNNPQTAAALGTRIEVLWRQLWYLPLTAVAMYAITLGAL